MPVFWSGSGSRSVECLKDYELYCASLPFLCCIYLFLLFFNRVLPEALYAELHPCGAAVVHGDLRLVRMYFALGPAERLDGKVAIITGGASGIGHSAVKLFWENGAKLDENVSYVHCDVSKEENVSNLIDAAVSKYGTLDIMYNNAGIIDCIAGSILTMEKSALDEVLGVNLVGELLGAKHAARVMVPNHKDCILFTGSASASIVLLSSHVYTASKSAILGVVKNLAGELGQYGIREAFLSEVGNLKDAVLKVDDVAFAALYLASDEARLGPRGNSLGADVRSNHNQLGTELIQIPGVQQEIDDIPAKVRQAEDPPRRRVRIPGIMCTRQASRMRLVDEEDEVDEPSVSGRGRGGESSDVELLEIITDAPLAVAVPEVGALSSSRRKG
ncbi:hypothetical protein GIB67_013675 [Kingdonia uniflora]|uniref:Uncharacterized protein n=1 Tax=Kingdonia uniflora TaxID=39325 RepID=A0A7J7NPX6_9MAGN|nr:hypothetical protein GIB67_013675 [Kingdonia uniflora]